MFSRRVVYIFGRFTVYKLILSLIRKSLVVKLKSARVGPYYMKMPAWSCFVFPVNNEESPIYGKNEESPIYGKIFLKMWWLCVAVVVMGDGGAEVWWLWWCVALVMMGDGGAEVGWLWWCVAVVVMGDGGAEVWWLWWCVAVVVMSDGGAESRLALCGARVERFPLTINPIEENIFFRWTDEALRVKHVIGVSSDQWTIPSSRKPQDHLHQQLADSEDNFGCHHECDSHVHHSVVHVFFRASFFFLTGGPGRETSENLYSSDCGKLLNYNCTTLSLSHRIVNEIILMLVCRVVKLISSLTGSRSSMFFNTKCLSDFSSSQSCTFIYKRQRFSPDKWNQWKWRKTATDVIYHLSKRPQNIL